MWLLTWCEYHDVAEFYLTQLRKEDLLSLVILKQTLKRVNTLTPRTNYLSFTPTTTYVFSEYYGPAIDSSTDYVLIQEALLDLLHKNRKQKDEAFCYVTDEEVEAIRALVGELYPDYSGKIFIGQQGDQLDTYLAYDGDSEIEDVYEGDKDFVAFELSDQLILDSL